MKRKRYYRSDYLFSKSGYLVGAGSVGALMGNYFEFNGSKSGRAADAKALESDWGTVGNIFCSIFDSLGKRI